MATANLGMDLPTVSSTLGPAWATKLNAALELLDAHDHTSGKGARVPSAGLNIDADLPFNSKNATLLRTVRFASQSGALAVSTDLGCVYNVNGDLYWNNGSGTAVQITSGASVNAGSGSIGGLPSGSASASFASATFTWRQATNQAALMDVGPLVIRDTAASALGITLQSPVGIAGAYSITLPSALPAAAGFLQMSTAGVLSVGPNVSAGITTSHLADGGVTRAKLAAVGQQVSSSSGSFAGSATSFTNITNLAVTITTTGRPVVLQCVADDGGGVLPAGFVLTSTGAVNGAYFQLRLNVTGSATTTIGWVQAGGDFASASGQLSFAPSVLSHFYVPAAGTYTFQVQYLVDGAGRSLNAKVMKLIAYEL